MQGKEKKWFYLSSSCHGVREYTAHFLHLRHIVITQSKQQKGDMAETEKKSLRTKSAFKGLVFSIS